MNSVPGSLVLAIAAFGAIVTAGRWWLVSDTNLDRVVNRLWSWEICGFLVHGIVSAAGFPNLARQLFMCCGLMAGAAAYGFARLLFEGKARYQGRRRQSRYDTLAAVAAGTLLLAEPARNYLLPFDWSSAVWAGSGVFTTISGLMILRVCARDLRTGDLTTREMMLDLALLVLSIYWTVGSAISVVRTVAGVPPTEPGVVWVTVTFASFFLVTLLISIPMVNVLLTRVGWDRASRHCRRLGPMWHDLTAAVPEVVLPHDDSARDDSAYRRYRMTVEIWDAMLQLRPYMQETGVRPMFGDGAKRYAQMMAWAGHAKVRGALPASKPGAWAVPRPPDRSAELRTLLALARVWPAARTRVQQDIRAS